MAECGAPFDAIIQQRYVNETTWYLSLLFKSFCTSLDYQVAVSSCFHKVNSNSFFFPHGFQMIQKHLAKICDQFI